jgi:hypothetical protein
MYFFNVIHLLFIMITSVIAVFAIDFSQINVLYSSRMFGFSIRKYLSR